MMSVKIDEITDLFMVWQIKDSNFRIYFEDGYVMWGAMCNTSCYKLALELSPFVIRT